MKNVKTSYLCETQKAFEFCESFSFNVLHCTGTAICEKF